MNESENRLRTITINRRMTRRAKCEEQHKNRISIHRMHSLCRCVKRNWFVINCSNKQQTRTHKLSTRITSIVHWNTSVSVNRCWRECHIKIRLRIIKWMCFLCAKLIETEKVDYDDVVKVKLNLPQWENTHNKCDHWQRRVLSRCLQQTNSKYAQFYDS